jgi:hypothetical protein
MNKLEELKALIAEEKKWRLEWANAHNAGDDGDVVLSYRKEFHAARTTRRLLTEELLPDLIAVAEAANNRLLSDLDVVERFHAIGEDRLDALETLAKTLLPLTKEQIK